MNLRRLSLLMLLPGLLLAAGCRAALTSRRITAAELSQHVTYLASDELAGRETGEPGIELAERYIAGRFSAAGLRPVPGRDDLFLDFPLYRHTYDPEQTQLRFARGEVELAAEPGVDFRPFWFSQTGTASAPVVFAGYGITAPEHGWDDYRGLDVRGKLVLVLRHEPNNQDPASPFSGKDYTRHAYFVTKARNALAHGAAGMILFTDPLFPAAGADDLRLNDLLTLTPEAKTRRSSDTIPIPAVHITGSLASRLVAPSGYDLESLQRAVDRGMHPSEIDLGGLEATLGVGTYGEASRIAARNVAGFVPGRSPELADEWIVIGAHHDHLGAIPAAVEDNVYNGADDNASGTAGVIELAERFSGLRRPRRSLLFITFSGEEMGLLGSQALFEQDLIPTDRVVFMINLDMIGRNPDQPVHIYGAGFHLPIREIIEQAGQGRKLAWRYEGIGEVPANSDYGPFFDAHIPYLSFFTGEHKDYHQLSDEAGLIAYDRMKQILDMTADVIERLDSRDDLRPLQDG